ncbi:MAG: hypothetical protein EOP05_08780 [Proteobacteria bacterium]|nr:MAG: hypothetical protein EOP05_08780 [Pseudomonadota bacterium]
MRLKTGSLLLSVLIANLLSLAFTREAFAYLTSDVDVGVGYTNIDLKVTDNSANLTSLGTLDASFNLNNAAWNTAFTLNVTEAMVSSQGPLAWTRLSVGGRYYLTGFNSQRVIFDNKVEGVYRRPAPFLGATVGYSAFSVKNLGADTGYFNAACMDFNLRGGAEVVLGDGILMTGQWSALVGLPTANTTTGKDISYFGFGIYVGVKVVSY